MSKVKAFFKKIGAYIKNTAWIQPILIVIVIFVVLFSLNPISEAIKSGWKKITTVNKMEEITYGEYVEMVYSQDEGEDFIVVFTDKDCSICADLYKSMNTFLKEEIYKDGDFKIYNVDLSTRNAKAKIDGKKYVQYKDSTLGLLAGPNESKQSILDRDYLKQLDERIDFFVFSAGDSYSELTSVTDDSYAYVSTPLFIWYQNGMETRISNSWSASSNSTASDFRKFISDFEGSVDASDFWSDSFNLTYNKD